MVSESCHPERAQRVEGPASYLRRGSLDSLRSLGMTRLDAQRSLTPFRAQRGFTLVKVVVSLALFVVFVLTGGSNLW